MMRRSIKVTAVFLCLFIFASCGQAADIIVTPSTVEISPSRLSPSENTGYDSETVELIEITEPENQTAEPETEAAIETVSDTSKSEETIVITAIPETTAEPETVTVQETILPETVPPETHPPETSPPETEPPVPADENGGTAVIINTSSRKYHTHPECSYAAKIAPENRIERRLTTTTLERSGYTICSWCGKKDAEQAAVLKSVPAEKQTEAETTESPPITAAPEKKKTAMDIAAEVIASLPSGGVHVVLNVNSGTYHTNDGCSYAAKIKTENRIEAYLADPSALDAAGYKLCSYCEKASQAKAETSAPPKPETTAAAETQAVPETLPSRTDPPSDEASAVPGSAEKIIVIINKNSKTFHISDSCSAVISMKDDNKLIIEVDGESGIFSLIEQGYKPCGRCAKEYKNG